MLYGVSGDLYADLESFNGAVRWDFLRHFGWTWTSRTCHLRF